MKGVGKVYRRKEGIDEFIESKKKKSVKGGEK